MGNGVNAVFGGFEDSIHVDFGRNFLRQYLYAVFVGILLAILLLVSVAGYLFFELMVQESSLWEIRVSPWLRSLFFVFMSYWISALLFYFGSTKGSGRTLFCRCFGHYIIVYANLIWVYSILRLFCNLQSALRVNRCNSNSDALHLVKC